MVFVLLGAGDQDSGNDDRSVDGPRDRLTVSEEEPCQPLLYFTSNLWCARRSLTSRLTVSSLRERSPSQTRGDHLDADQCEPKAGDALEQSVELGLIPDDRFEHSIPMLVPQSGRTELTPNQISQLALDLETVRTSCHYVFTLAHRA